MPDEAGSKSNSEAKPSGWLMHQWVVAGIVSSAARFIPVPFVDGYVQSQCRRYVVRRTLAAHERPELLRELTPYFDDGSGCLAGCVGSIVKVPLKLLLFPIRKIISIVTSIRGVPLEIVRTVLLGRTLDRYLRNGPVAINDLSAKHMRTAFDAAFARMDFHVVQAAMADALSSVGGWKSAAIKCAKSLANGNESAEPQIESEPKVDDGATNVQQVLDRPETLELFAKFDQRFDEILNGLPTAKLWP
ncbi:hypothetical protein [Aureliella helgolandensis]|uniref:Uncharacterized protein n=1 Tax=Aureliella helgolandensis TaxID=2527968 RepID=A0A518G4V0_9BACT|nr:hypothetical protein [Aureliella helgolandensis]QDV23621.1 hypothetical protein Q31a_19240 [Aureliella helgolandensis]